MNFTDFKILHAPPSLYYIPNFITKEEEEYLLNKIYCAPKPKWTQLSHRKLQNWGGLPHVKGMIVEDLPPWLQFYAEKIGKLGTFEDKKPNHVLVNEYLPGQGIMPHEDGPLFYPVVSTINLASHTFLDFYCPLETKNYQSEKDDQNAMSSLKKNSAESLYENRYQFSVLLEPRSLILVCDDMYKVYLHGISEKLSDVVNDKVINLNYLSYAKGETIDRKTRISLTFRYVPKLLKSKLLLGNK